ncbi:HypC/HybG/HupF family hydrogenase formation chaperone [Notoacmeibacter sp. MSK16QG-6]|uniref:HypC/HybG/HupF family hydrogenase formation chaperone n=1 Tax=Notoacmeibacter sp. MSK16QG-6 TaxID=2957982 RepID=UPI0020A0BEA1|nr:HypC/HybG/HupF family hydrogenase formation chaperone [Notoacmeibacter sp. MSK16QG-6]MCP1198369.1 HypC/HybG/HupF family hydrogenase formation chaperone [Notoacmeibacter sp. MSK16QG-6]
MCIGVPMQVISVEGVAAKALERGELRLIDMSLVGAVEPGTWVLTFLGAAREIISADSAEKITAALEGLRAIMAGGDAGNAFADLDNAAPQLPPHLEAAVSQGKTTA